MASNPLGHLPSLSTGICSCSIPPTLPPESDEGGVTLSPFFLRLPNKIKASMAISAIPNGRAMANNRGLILLVELAFMLATENFFFVLTEPTPLGFAYKPYDEPKIRQAP
jgi:hypothetical protein